MSTIEEIKQLCQAAIELSEKATPGPWESFIPEKKCDIHERSESMVARSTELSNRKAFFVGNTVRDDYDCKFIAQARTICPAAARVTLVAIRYAENMISESYADVIGRAGTGLLEEIRTAWEGRK